MRVGYSRQGRFDEAEKLTLDTIRRFEDSRGREHPDSVYAMWKLGELYERQGKIEKAVEAYKVALGQLLKKSSLPELR
jgi:hypothetical protein